MNRTQRIAELRAQRHGRSRRTAMRVRYCDEMGSYGEMELLDVRPGDLAKFEAEFVKHGDDESDDTEKTVSAGEIGEVVDVLQDALVVEAPCTLRGMGGQITGDGSMAVEPSAVVLMVDSRDPRISSNRIATKLGFWWPLLEMAADAAKKLQTFPGKGEFSIENPRHAAWALDTMIDGVRGTVPDHEVDYTDEDEDLAELADAMEALKSAVGHGSENWGRDLAQLQEAADYGNFYRAYPGAELVGLNPTGYAELGAYSVEQLQEQEQQRQRQELDLFDDEPASEPEEPKPPVEYYDEPTEQAIEDTYKEWGWDSSQLDRKLPEPEPQPEVPEEEPEPQGIPDRPAADAPTKYNVSMTESEPAKAPHDWANAAPAVADVEDAMPRVPVSVYRGYQGGSNKVWAEPEMHIRHKARRLEAVILEVLPNDVLKAQPINPKTGQPQCEPVLWDTGEVVLSQLHQFPAQPVSEAEDWTWRNDRRVRRERETRRQRRLEEEGGGAMGMAPPRRGRRSAYWGPMSRVTVVTAESLTLS